MHAHSTIHASSHITPTSHDHCRTYCDRGYCTNIEGHENRTVVENCTPQVKSVQELLEQLNKDRDRSGRKELTFGEERGFSFALDEEEEEEEEDMWCPGIKRLSVGTRNS